MDPLNVKQALRALVANTPREPAPFDEPERDPIKKLGRRIQADIVKEAPPGLLERAGSTAASGLSAVGNLLDVPGSMARDVLTWLPGGPKPANPFDQLLSPFSEKNRTTGRDLNRGYGLSGKEDTMLNFTGGMATEILTDPLTYLTFGASALTKGGRAAKALGIMDAAPEVASRALGRKVGKREARHIVTPRMLLSDPKLGKADLRLALENRMRKEFGLSEADMDRQLGGLARINLPFSDKPFSFGGKPFTWGGLTDEYGVIGAGKIRGRGRPLPSPEIEVPPPRGDEGDGWGSIPDDPTPPPKGGGSPSNLKPVDNLPPQAKPPIQPAAGTKSPKPLPKDPVTDEAKVAPTVKPKPDFDYTPKELDALRDFGYSDIEDVSYLKDTAKEHKTNPVRILAVESTVDNLVQMVDKEGYPFLKALDYIDRHVNERLDSLGLPDASLPEIDYAKKYASVIDRPVNFNDIVQYGKQQVADTAKGKQQQEAERIFKKFGSIDLDESAYYRAVLGEVPKAKKQKSLINETGVEGKAPSAVDASPEIPPVKLNEPFVHNTRVMVITEVNGVKVPFYLSTGEGGKKSVPTGKWYPFFGVGNDKWINKGSEKAINDFYGSPSLRAKAEELNNSLGPNYKISQPDLPIAFDNTKKLSGDRRYVAADVNEGFSPVSWQYAADNYKLHDDYISNAVARIEGRSADPKSAAQSGADVAPKARTYKRTSDGDYLSDDGRVSVVKTGSNKYELSIDGVAIEDYPTLAIAKRQAEIQINKPKSKTLFDEEPKQTGYQATIRNKAKRPEHGDDSGIKEKSARTIYVDERGSGLSAANMTDVEDAQIIFHPDNTVSLAWRNPKTGKLSASKSTVKVPYFTEPAVGLQPLEVWNKSDSKPDIPVESVESYKEMHLGNKITEITKDTPARFKTARGSEYTILDTDSASDLKLTNKKAKDKDKSLPSHEALFREDPELYQRWKDGEVEELSRYTNNPEHDGIYFDWVDAGLGYPWPRLVRGNESVWEKNRFYVQNAASDLKLEDYVKGPAKPLPRSPKSKTEKPVVVSEKAKDLIDAASDKADETVVPAVDKAKIARIDGWVRFLGNATEPKTQRPKYSPKEIEIARQVAYGDIEKALIEERQLKARNAAPRIGVMKFVQSAVANKILPEGAVQEASQFARNLIVKEQLSKINPESIKTAAQAEMLATRDIFTELSQEDKALFTGSKDFGKQVGEAYRDILAKGQVSKQAKPPSTLESAVAQSIDDSPASGSTTTQINLNTLEGLPDDVKPIIGEMTSKIGKRLFDDVKVEMGGMGRSADVAGSYDLKNVSIRIYDAAVKAGEIDKTLIHELWHHLSTYLPEEEVRSIYREYEDILANYKMNRSGPIPYELSNVDEYFAFTLTELTKKYVGREKPVTLIGKTWAKIVDVFEYIWDAIRQTLGYDQTKAIMKKFLSGKKADAARVSDQAMAIRMAKKVDPRDPTGIFNRSLNAKVEDIGLGDIDLENGILYSMLDETESSVKQTTTKAFKKWFGDWEKDPKNASKVVDVDGKPLVVYHGTTALEDFSRFSNPYAEDMSGNFHMFSDNPEYSANFSDGKNGRIFPVYLDIRNPLDLTSLPSRRGDVRIKLEKLLRQAGFEDPELLKSIPHERDLFQFINHGQMKNGKTFRQRLADEAEKLGYDGIKFSDAFGNLEKGDINGNTFVVFDSSKIKSATGNRGTFDPKSGNILESNAPPAPASLTSEQIAEQLSGFRSAKIGKGIDTAAQTVLDSALGRSLTALFDQSVLGQLSKAGQEAARLAFTGYRNAIYRERMYMSKFLRTWYETPSIREDEIIRSELAPIDEYIARANGNKKEAAIAQLVDARKIQNQRVNDIRRLLEVGIRDSEGRIIREAIPVSPEQLPSWVQPQQRQQIADMITSFRYKTLNMLRDENANGVLTEAIDGYFPRLLSELPGSSSMPWNPNYGKLLDPGHPNQKKRTSYLVGYSDGTSVINDISVDPQFSGKHTAKRVKEKLTRKEVLPEARLLWQKYGERLDPRYAELSFDQLMLESPGLAEKVEGLTRSMMELDPAHAKFQIPLFSNDLFSGFELRLEHHHRSIAHAKAIQKLISDHATSRTMLDYDKNGVTISKVLEKSSYDDPRPVKLVLGNMPKKTILEADKTFWNTMVANRANLIKKALQENKDFVIDLDGQRVPLNVQQGTAIFKNIITPNKKFNTTNYDLMIQHNPADPSDPSAALFFAVIDDGIPQELNVSIPNPLNATEARYRSSLPDDILTEMIVVPEDVAEAIGKFVKGPRSLEEVRPMIRGYDKLTNMWKMMQTGMLPFLSFHTRNLGSGQASNLFLGTQIDPRFSEFNLANPMTYINPLRSVLEPMRDAHRIATGQTIPGISEAPIFAGKNLTDEQATEELRKIIYANAIVGEKQGISAEQLMDTIGTAATQYPGVDGSRSVNPLRGQFSPPVPESTFAQRWFMPWMSKGVLADKDIFRPGQLGRDLGQYTESLNRLSPFISMIRRGYDPQAAAALVNKAQVDYTMLSNFEREYMRRMFPFYSYTRGVTPFVYGQLMERPAGAMGRQIIATTRAGQTDEQGVTPDYIRETASIPLGVSEDGTRSYITGFGMPYEDPLQFAQIARGNVSGLLRELGSRLNPVPKSVIETATGRSLYQAGPFGGREIEDLDPTIGRIRANISDLMTGEKTERAQPFLNNPWLEYAIANSGLGRTLNTIRTATDPRKYDTIPWKLLLNLGTGVRVADVSPSAQDAILRERLARVMKDFGGRMYTRPYFPDYAQESWTPEQAADAAKIEGIMKLLNQRATDRKRMEAAQ